MELLRIGFFGVFLVGAVAQASAETAKEIRDRVLEGDSDAVAVLQGTVTGIVAMDRTLRNQRSERIFCPSEGTRVTMDMLTDMVDAADAWDKPLAESLITAFQVAYPCPG